MFLWVTCEDGYPAMGRSSRKTTEAQSLGEFVRRGFTLKHLGSYVVELYHEDEVVARFSQLGATKESLQAECARHLAEKH
jgi:hypothetical protein